MNNLGILKKNRDVLLLAEAIGWLHDYRKCTDEHLKAQSQDLCKKVKPFPSNVLSKIYSDLSSINLHICINNIQCKSSLLELLNKRYQGLLGQYLRRCHNTSHFDKQEPTNGKQKYMCTSISTPFGFEKKVGQCLTSKLLRLPWRNLIQYNAEKRKKLRKELEELFLQGLGDTRRPVNEVDLWSWGLLVGSLYKAALAGSLLRDQHVDSEKLQWRLLCIRFDGPGFFLKALRIPDLLARQELLKKGLDSVRELLEVEYPLGSEVYRDENGNVFVVPDLANLLELTDENDNSMRDLILEKFQSEVEGEIQPHVELETEPWWGQDPEYRVKRSNGIPLVDKLPDIANFLIKKHVVQPDSHSMFKHWHNNVSDICTVCGLRPQGPDAKTAERSVCEICEERRAGRSKEWATKFLDESRDESDNVTIWTDEAADENGLLALVVGRFYLDYWLDGTLLETLFLIPPHNTNTDVKSPSFSRLRRIWETTRIFWHEAEEKIRKSLETGTRLSIKLSTKPGNMLPFHVYEMDLGKVNLDVVWVENDNGNGYLLSADNLCYIARQLLGYERRSSVDPMEAANRIKEYLLENFTCGKKEVIIYSPETRQGQKKKNLFKNIFVKCVFLEEKRYSPIIPVLQAPNSFMVIVPAANSLKAIDIIKKKYELEMGKVRDRLPINLGVIYAGSKMPVRSLLEAGKVILSKPLLSPEVWKVENSNFENNNLLVLNLEKQDRSLSWKIPLKMSDRVTDDNWYPYLFLAQDERQQSEKKGNITAPLPLGNGKTIKCPIFHARNLKKGDQVYLWPSTFDFEYLDTNARRFEVYYNRKGQRHRRTRPFYLEDLKRLEALWCYFKELLRSKRHQLIYSIENTREAWYGLDNEGASLTDEVFHQFVADTLARAFDKWDSIPEELIKAGIRGELSDLAELYMGIMKE